MKEITPREFVEKRAGGAEVTLLDVREGWELERAPVPSEIVHIPMGKIADRLRELDPEREIVVICRSGGRSTEVARFLERNGFKNVANLTGGILKWSADLDPSIPRY